MIIGGSGDIEAVLAVAKTGDVVVGVDIDIGTRVAVRG